MNPFLEYLYKALRSSYGISVLCELPDAIKAKLYAARRESGDEDLSTLSVVIPPDMDPPRIWIIRREKEPDSTS